jgi:hypothetical protein
MRYSVVLFIYTSLIFASCNYQQKQAIPSKLETKKLNTKKDKEEDKIQNFNRKQWNNNSSEAVNENETTSNKNYLNDESDDEQNNENDNNTMMHSTQQGYLIGKYHKNAYGLGVHSDGTGRAFKWQTSDGEDVDIFKVEPNGYGRGVGKDEFGRPVYANPK